MKFMKKVNTFRQNFAEKVRHTVSPEDYTCLICGIEIFGGRLCKDCSASVTFNDGAACPVCGRRTPRTEVCLECKYRRPDYARAVSCFVYRGGGAVLVSLLKHGKAFVSDWLAEMMCEKIARLPRADAIVAVPMTRKEVKRRGYNQSALLASKISRLTDIPFLPDAVRKESDTPEQKGLSRTDREANLKKCFKAQKSAVRGKAILIVDDVMTTGATLNSLAACIKRSGAREVYAVTAASVELTKSCEPRGYKRLLTLI